MKCHMSISEDMRAWKDDHEEGFVTGRMTNNILVHFAGDESLIGQIVTVHLDECKGFYYMGRLIED